jgi:hypothetical protein
MCHRVLAYAWQLLILQLASVLLLVTAGLDCCCRLIWLSFYQVVDLSGGLGVLGQSSSFSSLPRGCDGIWVLDA